MLYGDAEGPGPKGLLFLSYESEVNTGFLTQQHLWANSEVFQDSPGTKPKVGLDMVIAQVIVMSLSY